MSQKPLNSSIGMFRSLPIIPMRQEQYQIRTSRPLLLTSTYVLIYNSLGSIGKVSKLGLPNGQKFLRQHRVTILKSKDSQLRQTRILNSQLTRIRSLQFQLGMFETCLLICDGNVSVREGSSLNILSHKSYSISLLHQRTKGQLLGCCPIDS